MSVFLQKIIKFNREKGRQGVAIYLAVVTLSIVLAIALGVGALAAGLFKNLNQAGDSVAAFAAAETGIEWSLSDYNSETTLIVPGYDSGYVGLGEAGYQVNVYSCNGNICIRSIGTYKNAHRAIKVEL